MQPYYSQQGSIQSLKLIENSHYKIQYEDDKVRVRNISSPAGKFRTIAGDLNVATGCFYWEVVVESGNIKIGVSELCEEDTCFSDYSSGYAFYTLGQLRHRNDSMGVKYGVTCITGTVIGVLFDRNQLAFFINRNYFGVAFRDLNHAYLVPAIAMQPDSQVVVRYGMGIPHTYSN